MQFLAGNEQTDRPQVRRRVVRLEVAVALGVAQAVDDASGRERHVHELEREHDDAGNAEHHDVEHEQQHRAPADQKGHEQGAFFTRLDVEFDAVGDQVAHQATVQVSGRGLDLAVVVGDGHDLGAGGSTGARLP